MLLHEIIDETQQLYPQKCAIESKERCITYEALNKACTKLALYLLTVGIQKGDRAAVLLHKSIDMVATFLGILKCGACYIPMDTAAPNERISYILQDAQVRFILTDSMHLEQALSAKNENMAIILIGEEGLQGEEEKVYFINLYAGVGTDKACLPYIDLNENDLAYILYTSGSTGEPKGVALSHKNAVCFVNWACEYFEVSTLDTLSSHAPFYFDLSVFDIYVSMKAGAKLCLLPPSISAFPESLTLYIEEKGITIWYSVPSVLVKILHFGKLETVKLPKLRKILYAGEAFPAPQLKELMQLLPETEFFNLYGPTETNVITYYPIKYEDCNDEIPIGYACPYAKIWVMKENGELAKAGEKGELIVQSSSLMKGYYNKEQFTKNVLRFIDSDLLPYGSYYFTGDIVKVIEKGLYQFVCRKDHMVKIKGFRIELEEIEAVLKKNPRIKECVIQVIASEKIDPYLRAYVVSNMIARDIIGFAKKFLPEYMIPYEIKYVPEFEYTDRGKVNRRIIFGSEK